MVQFPYEKSTDFVNLSCEFVLESCEIALESGSFVQLSGEIVRYRAVSAGLGMGEVAAPPELDADQLIYAPLALPPLARVVCSQTT